MAIVLAARPGLADTTTRVSVSTTGGQANGDSGAPSLSADARYVAFYSFASNLVQSDDNGIADVFVYDRTAQKTIRVSVATGGVEATGDHSHDPAISADGRHVVFTSRATNLVPNDANNHTDIFVHDRDPDGNGVFDEGNGTTTRVNLGPGGVEADGNSNFPVVSGNGRYIAFESDATNLLAPDQDTNGFNDIFVSDRDPDGNGVFDEGNGVVRRVSIGAGGVQANYHSYWPSISGNGRYVSFHSGASNLDPASPQGPWDIFVYDRDPDGNGVFDQGNGVIEQINRGQDGQAPNGDSFLAALSADGQYVVFYSFASNLVPTDTNGRWDCFVYDRINHTTERASIPTGGGEGNGDVLVTGEPSVSADGRIVLFDSYATNLVADDTNGYWDVFVRDRDPDGNGVFEPNTGFTTRVSVGQKGAEGNCHSYNAFNRAMTPDGRFVAFPSCADSFVLDDTCCWDIFLHDREEAGAPVFQPDAMIRRGGDLAYLGVGVLNTDGTGQTRAQNASSGSTTSYIIAIANDGDRPDALVVTGTAAGAGWTMRYFDAPAGGTDITARVTAPGGYPVATFTPRSTVVFRAELTPDEGLPNGLQLTSMFTATSVRDPFKSDTVKMLTMAVTPGSLPEGRVYTLDDDFDEGILIGVQHETVHDQLQLAASSATFPFIWVPNSNEGTISKVDATTGRELGRYRVCPNTQPGNPSRTTVDLEGNCWVGNRQIGTVTKVGLLENGGYVDRNGNGTIETSRDLNGDGSITGDELLPWGWDECVLWEVVLIPGYAEGPYVPGTYPGTYANDYWNPGPRGLAVDRQNNVWVGTWGTQKYYYLNGTTGQIHRIVDVSLVGHSAYGAVIDPNGILWSSSHTGWHVLWLDTATYRFGTIPVSTYIYGLGIDQLNHLFVSGWNSGTFYRIDCISKSLDWSKPTARQIIRGMTVTDDGDVWTADSDGMYSVSRYSNDGDWKHTLPVGSNPTGVTVDAAGKVWVVNNGDEFIRRIDPATNSIDLSKRILGGNHYGYSDMTGVICRSTTTRMGNWSVVHDSRTTDSPWGTVSWTAGQPASGSLTVQVRSSNDCQTWSAWEAAGNAQPLAATPPGRFLQVRVTFQSLNPGENPILEDLTVAPAAILYQPDLSIRSRSEREHKGTDIYSCPPDESQTSSEQVYNERPGTYEIRIQNDGNFPDSFVLQQSAASGICTVVYVDVTTGGDITAQVVGSGWNVGPLRSGESRDIQLTVTFPAGTPAGATCTVPLEVRSVSDMGKCDAVAAVTISDGPEPAPACKTYTLCADFQEGNLIGLVCTQDQLEFTNATSTFPFIWVPNSNEGTVSKVDTLTGRELGRYQTGPTTTGSPSRTTVDQQGNCWVGNRGTGTVVKIGLLENGGYVDRNQNGVIDTSIDFNGNGDISQDEMLPWGEDECVIYEIVVIDGGTESTFIPGTYTGSYSSTPVPRAIAVDADGNIWAGTYGTGRYYKINGVSGQIMKEIAANHGPYGAVVGPDGMLWSASAWGNAVFRLNPADDSVSSVPLGHCSYGLGLNAKTGRLYVSGWTDSKLSQVDTATLYLEARVTAKYQTRGVAVTDDGDVWTACSWDGTVTRWRTSPITGAPEIIATIPVGDTPTGVAVDAEGKVWAVDYGDEYIHRINPATNVVDLSKRIIGGYHYGYSDMTGIISRIGTGTWTVVHDTRVPDRSWGLISWSSDEPSPETRVMVKVRSSNDQLTWSGWEPAINNERLKNTPPGRFLQIEATLRRSAGGESPILYGLTVCPAPFVPPDLDRDGDVDAKDFAEWQGCSSGPGIPYTGDCAAKDPDSDGDVDQVDFSLFQRCYSGENVPADPNCAN